MPSKACITSSLTQYGYECLVSSDSEHFVSSLWETLALTFSLETNVPWLLAWMVSATCILTECKASLVLSARPTSSDFFQSALCLEDAALVPFFYSHCIGGMGGSSVVSTLVSCTFVSLVYVAWDRNNRWVNFCKNIVYYDITKNKEWVTESVLLKVRRKNWLKLLIYGSYSLVIIRERYNLLSVSSLTIRDFPDMSVNLSV